MSVRSFWSWTAKVIGKLCSTELAVNGIGAAFFFYLAFAVINEGWLIREICHKQSNYPERESLVSLVWGVPFFPAACHSKVRSKNINFLVTSFSSKTKKNHSLLFFGCQSWPRFRMKGSLCDVRSSLPVTHFQLFFRDPALSNAVTEHCSGPTLFIWAQAWHKGPVLCYWGG